MSAFLADSVDLKTTYAVMVLSSVECSFRLHNYIVTTPAGLQDDGSFLGYNFAEDTLPNV